MRLGDEPHLLQERFQEIVLLRAGFPGLDGWCLFHGSYEL
jgi:hypothetical protein